VTIKKFKSRSALPFLPTLLTVLGMAILCILGAWQLQRLEWKRGIIEKLDRAYAAADGQALDLQNFRKGDFVYGQAEGLLLTDKALLIGPRTQDGQVGYKLIVPLQVKDSTLLVDLGWTDLQIEDLQLAGQQGKPVRFEGLARTPDWNVFTPENDPQRDIWYRADIGEIAAAKNLKNSLPIVLYAERFYGFDVPLPGNLRRYPHNNHLHYAVFWFSMAGVLAVVYLIRFGIPAGRDV
jgi:surfeit locus 1 family protein